MARAAQVPVIFTQHVLYDSVVKSPLEASANPRLLNEGVLEGTDGIEIIDELGALPADYRVA